MEDLNKAIAIYVENAKLVNEAGRKLATAERSLFSMFSKSAIKDAQSKLSRFYDSLEEADLLFTSRLVLRKTLTQAYGGDELDSLASQSTVVSSAREIYISSLSAFEKNITNIEGILNFRLNTTIALIAIVVSLFGLL